MTNLVILVAGGALALIGMDASLSRADIPLGIFLVVLGFFGAAFSEKYHERFQIHAARARRFLGQLEEYTPGFSLVSDRKAGDTKVKNRYSITSRVSLRLLWLLLNASVSLLGAGVIIVALRS